MVKRYPDHITVTKVQEPTQNNDGDWVMPTGVNSFSSKCRFQPAGKNNVIRGRDGDEIFYDYKVFLPKITDTCKFGDTATGICEGSDFTGTIKGFHNRQTFVEIWV